MSDLISREALKKAIDTWDKFGYTAQGELIRLTEKNKDLYVPYVKYQDIVNCIDNAPTVERPQGKWILQTYERFNSGNELYKYDCNKCGHREEHAYSDSKLPNFCPNCGARMRKERKK